mmetsp:Transcript_9647/g.18363  ORF Transcript_9647/g.18363 Transcript_9647/m.18363 type:complete len:474 (+) Transcript_9647:9-1430(+)
MNDDLTAKMAEINLAAAKRIDPHVSSVIHTSKHVAVYHLSSSQEWERQEIEGPLLIVKTKPTTYRVLVLNRKGLGNLAEDIQVGLDVEQQGQYIFFRSGNTVIGLWFYDSAECTSAFAMLQRLKIAAQTKKSPAPSPSHKVAPASFTPAKIGSVNTKTGQPSSASGKKAKREKATKPVKVLSSTPAFQQPNIASQSSLTNNPDPLDLLDFHSGYQDFNKKKPHQPQTALATKTSATSKPQMSATQANTNKSSKSSKDSQSKGQDPQQNVMQLLTSVVPALQKKGANGTVASKTEKKKPKRERKNTNQSATSSTESVTPGSISVSQLESGLSADGSAATPPAKVLALFNLAGGDKLLTKATTAKPLASPADFVDSAASKDTTKPAGLITPAMLAALADQKESSPAALHFSHHSDSSRTGTSIPAPFIHTPSSLIHLSKAEFRQRLQLMLQDDAVLDRVYQRFVSQHLPIGTLFC